MTSMIDSDLEAAIDAAGRDAVFARARSYGYTEQNPPEKYVWRQIVEEVKQAKPVQYTMHLRPDTRPMHEQLLGFRLW